MSGPSLRFLVILLLAGGAFLPGAGPADEPPNIVVILTDDQGYADVGFNPHHPPEVRTPHMDALAREGVICRQGYVSGHVCSPTRAGLMTGRYQQRFGVYTAGEGGSGVPLDEVFLPEYLKPAGYVSGAFGKWHLGLTPDYNPVNRGFDEFYGFMGRGAHDYFNLADPDRPLYRGLQVITDKGYLTDRITEEAVAFIDRHKERRFFAYVAYNAVHAPAQAPPGSIRAETGDADRDTLMGMLKHLDDGVGAIVSKLKKEGLFENTLLFFLSDNGGAKSMKANNAPLRGFKQEDYEGGVRVPFVVSWPSVLQGGTTCDVPVISLDILPTAVAAAGAEVPPDRMLDGKNLIPALQGNVDVLHRTLYWSSGGVRAKWAIRSGRWKLVGVRDRLELFDLEEDPGESRNLASGSPAEVARLRALHDSWLEGMAEPMKGGPKRWRPGLEEPSKKRKKEKKKERKKSKDGGSASAEPAPGKADRPNVLFIVCDDLNTRVGPSGYGPIRTPSMDRLAAEGTRFLRAYAQYPVCGPSRASFLSGLYPETTRVLSNKVDLRQTRPGTVTLPRRFRESGYWTAAVGKVFHRPGVNPDEAAWDAVEKYENERNPVIEAARRAFEETRGSTEDPKNGKAWRARLRELRGRAAGQTPPGYGPTGMTDAEHKDGKNARRIAAWLDERAFGEKPFFLACGIQKPHVPFWAPRKYFDLYPRETLPLRPVPPDDWDDIPPRARVKRYAAFGFEAAKENEGLRRAYTQAYHACISFIDAQIGLVLDALKRNGLWENTVVVLTSDHGYHLGEHFLWGKVTLFEECARVPLVVRVPGRTRPGTVSRGIVELVDLYPTLAELCGMEVPDGLQGRSFTGLLDDPSGEGKPVAYTVVTRGTMLGRAVRTARWRYAEWGEGGPDELYDLSADPGEHRNLAGNSDHAATLKRLHGLLRRAQNAASDR